MTSWLQTHLPIMTTNELPKAKADDAAFWSRAHIVKWGLSFVDDPQQPWERQADKNLDEKIQAEAKGCSSAWCRGDGVPTRRLEGSAGGQGLDEGPAGDMGRHRPVLYRVLPAGDTSEQPAKYALRVAASDLHEAFCIWYAENKDKRYSISAKSFAQLLNKKRH